MSDSSLVTVEVAPFVDKDQKKVEKKNLHGSDLKLTCDINEHPKGTVKWFYRADVKKPKRQIKGDTKTLNLSKMKSKMQGIYECSVENSLGTAAKQFVVSSIPNGTVMRLNFEKIHYIFGIFQNLPDLKAIPSNL